MQQSVSLSPFQAHPPSRGQVSSCARKNKYSYATALGMVTERDKRKHSSKTAPILRQYHCPVCGWWHLTSQR